MAGSECHGNWEQPAYDAGTFFSKYWRRKPLLVRGGASAFLADNLSTGWFDAARTLAHERGLRVSERAGEVTFLEKVSAVDADLDEVARAHRKAFGALDAWFDAIRTYGRGGLGAHFDHSDNFVLQQSGVKYWTLESPRRIDKESLERRMLNLPGAHCPEFSQKEKLQFTLRGGDLLYIPLFWIHEGISVSASLSLSLVLPAVSVHAIVVPMLGAVLKRLGVGAHPVPTIHPHMSSTQRAEAMEDLYEAARLVLARTDEPNVLEVLQRMLTRQVAGSDTWNGAGNVDGGLV